MAGRSPRKELIAGNLLLVALLVVHTLDHVLRQDAPVPAATAFAGLAGIVAAVFALGLALAAHRLAPAGTAFVGIATAVGFVAIHVFPEWSVFSQPYADIDADAISWTAMIVPAVVGVGVGAIGVRAARLQQFSAGS